MSLILIEKNRAPGVLLLTLNRAERHNALSKPLLQELDAALLDAEGDQTTGCVVITGSGDRAFSAGADISEQTGFSPRDAYDHMRWGQDLFTRLELMAKPTVAAVNGFALGGGLELALSCDFRTASDSSQLGLPEVTLASLPGWGGTQRLPRLIGESNSKLIMMTGLRLSAERAFQLGLVNSVHPRADHLAESLSFAASIAIHSLESLQAIKQVVREGLREGMRHGMEAEAAAVSRLWGTPAQKRAQEAFFARGKTKASA